MLSKPGSWRLLATLPLIIILGVLIFPLSISLERIDAISQIKLNNSLPSIRKSSFLGTASPARDEENSNSFQVIVTAYSSRPEETDDDPFITASGQTVRQGIVANNLLPFGTVIRLPQLFGDQDFVVQDRMHHLKSDYHIDIWFASTEEAIRFGAKRTTAIIEQSI
jgi:3D (Asp-Asp-Asp) domain-containing protein